MIRVHVHGSVPGLHRRSGSGRAPRALAAFLAVLGAAAVLGAGPARASTQGDATSIGPKAVEIAELRQLLALQYPHLRPKAEAAPRRSEVTESSTGASSSEPIL